MLAVASAAAALDAQAVRGRVVDASSGGPAVGAIVSLVGGDGRRVASTLVAPDGAYRATAPSSGAWRVRVDLIGYEAWTSDLLALAPADTATLDVRLPLRRALLPTVSVQATTRCATRPDRAARTIALWEEVRRAVVGIALGEADRRPYELRVVERLVRADGPMGVTHRALLRAERVRPWEATDAARLDAEGWVRVDGDSVTYDAPDGDVLLSDAFLATHCFGLARRDERGDAQIGLTFAPLPDRALPDVAGTIWLDSATSALRVVGFAYTGVADSLSTGEPPGGSLAFARLPTGAWYLREWTLRLPNAARATHAASAAPRRRRRDPDLWRFVPYRERVGEAVPLASADRGDPRTTAVLSGRVTDSTTGAPLADALVLIPGEPAVRTDADGRYAADVRGVPDRDTDYRVSITHERLAALGLPDLARVVSMRAGTGAVVDLAVPSLATLLRGTCGAGPAMTAGGTRMRAGLAVGRLRAADGAALPDSVHVEASWAEPISLAQSAQGGAAGAAPTVAVREDGHFTVCPLPFDRDVELRASHDGRVAARLRFRLPTSGVAVGDLVLGAPAPTAPGR